MKYTHDFTAEEEEGLTALAQSQGLDATGFLDKIVGANTQEATDYLLGLKKEKIAKAYRDNPTKQAQVDAILLADDVVIP